MNQSLANKLVLCDLDNLLLGPDGNLTQVVRDVLQLFSSRGGRFTVFSQRTPKAVRAILGSVRLSAPALVCGGTLAYHFADGSRQPLCSFAGQDAGLFASLPSAAGVGIALQMQDGSTRVLRMSEADRRLLYSSGSEHWKECRDELYGVLGAAGYAALEAEANPKKQSRGGSGIWAAEKY